MNRYIDADENQYTILHKTGIEAHGVWEDVINKTPTADVVEVVRCKDCKYMLQYEQINVCCNVNSFLQEPKYVSDHDFCSRGERKEE